MKKKLYKLLILSLFIILSTMPLAAHDNEQEKSIEDILALIRQEQSVNEDQAIDPDKVSKNLLEELGDAVMSIRHQDEREHQWMDEMMGGEGSESLRTMHIAMGYRFLRGDDRYGTPFHGPGFRGPRFHGPGMMKRGGGMLMMFNSGDHPYRGRMGWGPFSFMPLGEILFWLPAIIVLGAIITGAIIIIKRQRTKTGPLDILKVRLAKGEITVQEYEKLKQDIL